MQSWQAKWRAETSGFEKEEEQEDSHSQRSSASESCWQVEVQSREEWTGRVPETTVSTSERVTNFAGELAASIEAKRDGC